MLLEYPTSKDKSILSFFDDFSFRTRKDSSFIPWSGKAFKDNAALKASKLGFEANDLSKPKWYFWTSVAVAEIFINNPAFFKKN